jgi:hypothetical protein
VNRDFAEMVSALSEARAEFLIVGAHALAAHGIPRATGPLLDLTLTDLTTPDTVFQIGQGPSRVDILTGVSGVNFGDAWPRRVLLRIEGIEVPVLSRDDLIANKRATGRPNDLLDLELPGD